MRLTLTALALLSLAARTNGEQAGRADMADGATMPTSTAPSTAMPTVAAGYLAMAGASDQFEIQSSTLALQKSQNSGVRMFAQMMIDHHRGTTEQLTTAARAAGMTPPPPQLNPMQRDMMAKLQAASGAAFDRLYIEQQRTAHQSALALHSTYADRGDTPQLQQVARAAVPIIQQHITEAGKLTAG